MKSKFTLTLATDYVRTWGCVEAVREVFQNAIDQELMDADNKMTYEYSEDTQQLFVCSVKSILTPDTLLLGTTSKGDRDNLIGQFGEGYKLALLVLTRLGKEVKIYNYGRREVWTARFVNSRKFQAKVLEVTIETLDFWHKTYNADLVWEINNITLDEYQLIKETNLWLRDDVQKLYESAYGDILEGNLFRGKVYVKGLFVGNVVGLKYGYNFPADKIKLDRDRRLVNHFELKWETSRLWATWLVKDSIDTSVLEQLIFELAEDVQFIGKVTPYDGYVAAEVLGGLLDNFVLTRIAKYDDDVVFVENGVEFDTSKLKRNVVTVNSLLYSLITMNKNVQARHLDLYYSTDDDAAWDNDMIYSVLNKLYQSCEASNGFLAKDEVAEFRLVLKKFAEYNNMDVE